eukprot:10031414-Prorocentrum_lima.AAC.1
MGRLTYMTENARFAVDTLVMEEQAQGQKAQPVSEVDASEMRQHMLLLETKCCCGCTPADLKL